MFFTWNDSDDQLQTTLTRIKQTYANHSTIINLGYSVTFLDVEITQNQGKLRTNIHRPCLTEPYVLPYLVNYSTKFYQQAIRSLLVRAVQCCTHISDYYDEHRFIFTTCLFNHFPLYLIETIICEFFQEFNPSKLNNRYTQATYEQLRRQVLTTKTLPILYHIDKFSRYSDDFV